MLPAGLTQEDVAAWYDAASLNHEDGASLPVWLDISGRGRHLPAVNSQTTPTFRLNQWGDLAAVDFNQDAMRRQWGETIAQPYTIFYVFDIRGPLTPKSSFAIGSGYNTQNKHLFAVDRGSRFVIENMGQGGSWHKYGGVVETDTLYVARCDYAQNDVVYLNGDVIISGVAGSDVSTGVTIGARESTLDRYLAGHIGLYGFLKNVAKADEVYAELLARYIG